MKQVMDYEIDIEGCNSISLEWVWGRLLRGGDYADR
jgi:hypothetical protein